MFLLTPNFSGDLLSSSVKVILNQQNDHHIDYLMDVSMDAGARVAVERYGVGGGDTVQTTATIKQVTV